MKERDNIDIKKIVFIVGFILPIFIALISFTVLSEKAASNEVHSETIRQIDESKENVLNLTAATVASSAAITVIPGDIGTPIAEELAQMSKYFLIVLAALYFEKFILTISGIAVFKYLIPIACMVFIAGMFASSKTLKKFALKISLFGIAFFLTVPISVKISDTIQQTYHYSFEEIIREANEHTKIIEESSGNDDKTILDKIASTVSGGVSGFIDKFQKIVNSMLEALAILIVTNCLIPILVIFVLLWMVRTVFGNENKGV